jgi:hypothetical protein
MAILGGQGTHNDTRLSRYLWFYLVVIIVMVILGGHNIINDNKWSKYSM